MKCRFKKYIAFSDIYYAKGQYDVMWYCKKHNMWICPDCRKLLSPGVYQYPSGLSYCKKCGMAVSVNLNLCKCMVTMEYDPEQVEKL